MATLQEQIAQAKAAGYSDADIAQHLSQKSDLAPKIKTAMDAGYKPEEIIAHLGGAQDKTQQKYSEEAAKYASQPSAGEKDVNDFVTGVGNLAKGALVGVADVGDTVLDAGAKLVGKISPAVAQWNRTRNADMEYIDNKYKDSTPFKAGRIGGNVAATLPVGGALAEGLRMAAPAAIAASPRLAALANAIETGGMRAGSTPGAINMLTRSAGGAITGGASAGLIDPSSSGTGAALGAGLPPALALAGKAGNALGRVVSGPSVPSAVQQAVADARNLGYVIPPTQAKPTLANRLLEGFSGKITTAQNASAKNQAITNGLAQKAIGAAELSPAGIAQVRQQANAAYDALGQSTPFQADPAFHAALDKAGASTAELRKNFPELVNSEVDKLIEGLKSRPEFDAQPTIEAIKQFRADAEANRASTDPAKKALGKAQSQISGALEDLIDRNLQQSGNPQLLAGYRDARQTLAKTYDVEKALNASSGNIDASKLAQILKKGRPMTGELRQIADFASQFPKAAQSVEKMGSLPQVSPLDFGALGAMSAATSSPMLMAGVLARPAARYAALSDAVQNRLAQPSTPNRLLSLMQRPEAQQLIYRSAPVAAASR